MLLSRLGELRFLHKLKSMYRDCKVMWLTSEQGVIKGRIFRRRKRRIRMWWGSSSRKIIIKRKMRRRKRKKTREVKE